MFNDTPILFQALIATITIITCAVFSLPNKATAFSYKASLKPWYHSPGDEGFY